MGTYIHEELTKEIIGAAFEVHNVLGPGFLEKVYEEAMVRELGLRGLSVRQQVSVPIFYKGIEVGKHVLDLVVADKVLIELKASREVIDVHTAIVISYLAATKLPVALLLNFSKRSLEYKRIAG